MLSKPVSIIGSGGHARVVIALLHATGHSVNGLYDDSYTSSKQEQIMGCPLLGKLSDIPARGPVILAVGDNKFRNHLFERFAGSVLMDNAVHPRAHFEPTTRLGNANQVFANVYVNALAHIGDNNILNTGCIIEHECSVGSHNHISLGTVLSGRVQIGNRCFIGANAVVKDGVCIADDITIGAGAVVINDIHESGTYVGNPVRKLP